MLVLVVIVGALVWSTDGKIRFVVGVILAAIFAAVFILGSMYVYKTHSTLAGISGVTQRLRRSAFMSVQMILQIP